MTNASLNTGLYIDGHWQQGASTNESRNPTDTTDLIGHYAQPSTAQFDAARAAARAPQPLWCAAGIQRRHDVLMSIGTELMACPAEIGTFLAREAAKPAAEGKGEVYRVGQFFASSAASRLIVHPAIHDPFVEKLVKAAQALKVGHALQDGTQIGPVVSADQRAQNLDYLPTVGTDYHVPFGARGASSFGLRDQGTYAAKFYTTVKTAYVNTGEPE